MVLAYKNSHTTGYSEKWTCVLYQIAV